MEQQDQRVLPIKKWPSPRPTKPKDALFFARLVRQHQPRGVLAHFGNVNICTVVGWLMRVPVRVAWYQTLTTQQSELHPLRTFRKRLVYKLATQLITPSEAARKDVCAVYRVPPEKVWVWPYALPDPRVESRNDRFGYFCAARMHPSKGLDILQVAARQVAEPVTIVGEGTEAIGGRGLTPWSEVVKLMAEARAVIVPSRSEAFGLVAIEAMSVGTPVIASAVGGLPEIIRDGVDGFLVPPDDPDALAVAMERVSPGMGKAARQRFLDSFCTDTILPRQVRALLSL